MRFVNCLLLAVSAVASLAQAQSATLKFTDVPTTVTPGKAVTIKWTTDDNTTPVTIKLRVGPSNDLSDVAVLTSDGTDGAYTWTPDAGLGDSNYYALEIIQGNQINYSGPIALTGGSTSSALPTASLLPTASSASASASASSASASSASASSASSSGSSASASTLSTATITSASSSGTASASAKSKSNSASSGSLTSAATVTTSSPTSSSSQSAMGAPTHTGAAAHLGSSPMALVFGAVAAMAYLN